MTVLALILAALIIAALAGMVLMAAADGSAAAFFFGLLVLVGSGFGSIAYAFTVYSWVASDYKSGIINREYGTSYTREEVFFASDVIDTVRELNRQRIEVNGDVFTGKEGGK